MTEEERRIRLESEFSGYCLAMEDIAEYLLDVEQRLERCSFTEKGKPSDIVRDIRKNLNIIMLNSDETGGQ